MWRVRRDTVKYHKPQKFTHSKVHLFYKQRSLLLKIVKLYEDAEDKGEKRLPYKDG